MFQYDLRVLEERKGNGVYQAWIWMIMMYGLWSGYYLLVRHYKIKE